MPTIEDYFKGLADTTRLRIMNLLLKGELCGCDIQYVIGASQSNVSRHLNYLKNCGLVADRRAGFRVYYRLVEDRKPEHKHLLRYLQSAFKDNLFVSDARRLRHAIKNGACSISEIKPVSHKARHVTVIMR